MASGSQNMTTDKARQAFYLDAPNQYGYYTDEYGNFIYKYVPEPDTPATGYFHLDNNAKTISLRYYWDSGDIWVPGKVGIGYNPTTSGNTYSLYVNGTSYFTSTTYFGNGTTYYISADGSQYSGNSASATKLTSNAGGTEQPIYFTGGKPTATSYALHATVNATSVTNTFAYYSGTNAISSYSRIRNIGSARYPIDIYLYNDAGNAVAELWYDMGNATNVTAGRWNFLSFSPNSTANTGTTGKYEYYMLPQVTAGRTSNASYDILTTKNKVTNAQLQYSAITLGATSCSLGSTYDTITGPFNVLTSASEAKAFSICRSSTSEATKIWVDDSYTNFYVENDETSANIHFRLHAADTESGGGANASTANIYFYGSGNLSTIEADKFTKGYGTLYLNTKISKRPSGAAITQPGTDVNPVELVSFAASGSDFGVVHISNDGCYICNSADMGWAFAVFDTDKTVDFSNAANASFYVKQNQEGAVFKGTVTAASFDGSADKVDDWHRDDIRKGCLSFTRNINSANPTNLNNLNDGMAYNYGSGGYWQHAPSSPTYGSCIALTSGGDIALGGQFYWDINHNSSSSTRSLWFRAANNLGWQDDWKQLVWNSGSWGISVTGSSASCTGNAATATRINGSLGNATSNVTRNIWVSSTNGADGIPNYVSSFYMNPSTKEFGVPSGTRIYPQTGALYLGNSGNQSWVYVQDMASQASGSPWKLTQAGALTCVSVSASSSVTSAAFYTSGSPGSNCYLGPGNGDGNGNGTANIVIRSWYGVGFMNGCTNVGTNGAVTAGVDCRSGHIYANAVHNAVWNDYAECREAEIIEGGYCVTEMSNGKMIKTHERLQAGCKLTSDTYGSIMGETDIAKTPIAVAGRVLAHPYRARNEYHLGAAVCSAPDGTVDIMTRDEIMMYPERIVGTVSEIPDYIIWHAGGKGTGKDIEVKGRIWIYVR